MVPPGHARRLHDRLEPHRKRARRSGPGGLREFHLRRRGQLRPLLQPGDRQNGRPSIDGIRRGKAKGTGVGDRAQAGGRGSAPDPLAQSFRYLLAPLRQGLYPNGEQHLQRQPVRGHLARQMMRRVLVTVVAGAALAGLGGTHPALAQKQGGILKVYHRDSPASMSILEEATISTVLPMMGVFNNLVVYDQNVKQNSLQSIAPDLATSWETSEDGTQLTFKLREGVKWHDGKP